MRYLYTVAAYLAAPLVSLAMLWRGLTDRSYRTDFSQRFGFGTALGTGSIWIHAVSVGEVQAAAPLVQALRERYPAIPVVLTTLTPTGAARARSLFRDVVSVRYVPFDLPGSVYRFLERVRPRLAVILETELWPNLYHQCRGRQIPLVLASARISDKSVRRYRRLGSLFRDALAQVAVVAAQSRADAERFAQLGAATDRTHVIGNIKFEFNIPSDIAQRGAALRERYARDRPSWVAGSTHAGEETDAVLAHGRISQDHPDALLILVPRHPPRFEEVAQLLQRAGVRFVRRSDRVGPTGREAVLLVDTLGELLDFYAATDVAFVGGSLVPIGGHNLLEPAAVRRPVLTGPHNENGAEIAKLLLSEGAAEVVSDAACLGRRVAELLADAAARDRIGGIGQDCVARNRGALQKLLVLIEPLLRG